MQYFRVKNFKKYQAPNTPLWIKLFHEIWLDYQFQSLNDSDKLLFIGILSVAGQLGNSIPSDMGWLRKRLLSPMRQSSISNLMVSGLIELINENNDIEIVAESVRTPRVEKNRVKKTIPKGMGDSKPIPPKIDRFSPEFRVSEAIEKFIHDFLDSSRPTEGPGHYNRIVKWLPQVKALLDGGQGAEIKATLLWLEEKNCWSYWKTRISDIGKFCSFFSDMQVERKNPVKKESILEVGRRNKIGGVSSGGLIDYSEEAQEIAHQQYLKTHKLTKPD